MGNPPRHATAAAENVMTTELETLRSALAAKTRELEERTAELEELKLFTDGAPSLTEHLKLMEERDTLRAQLADALGTQGAIVNELRARTREVAVERRRGPCPTRGGAEGQRAAA